MTVALNPTKRCKKAFREFESLPFLLRGGCDVAAASLPVTQVAQVQILSVTLMFTEAQIDALRKLKNGVWRNAEQLAVPVFALRELQDKKLVECARDNKVHTFYVIEKRDLYWHVPLVKQRVVRRIVETHS